ncbi:hypothetical protein JOD24_000534 [Kroppenstedtia sanguinis]|uniref:DUF2892 domain-containing protein n=1 Tax=Kroppenstedtia sanguinis TaxID=1380684 RepID=A0ABW4CD26_9BACL
MKLRQWLVRISFVLSGLSIVIFAIVLDQGLTAFILAAVFVAIAGFLMKT